MSEQDEHDEHDEHQPDAPEEPKLSAAFLPYDDERLWVGMPEDQRGKSRPKKRRPARRSPRTERDGSAPTRVSRLNIPVSFGRKQIAATVLTLALPLTAFAVTGAISGDVELPAPLTGDSGTTLTPSPVMLDISGLRAERVSPKRVELAWEAPDVGGALTYSIYRDGAVIAETDGPSFVDTDVEPQRYYYYAVATVGSDGTAASSPQLLVAVPSKTGQLPEGPAPAAPAPIVVVSAPSLSPSPSRSPSPTKSKVVWPSTDFGSGPAPCPSTQAGCPGYVDPCSIDNTQFGCPGYVDPCSIDNTQFGCPGYVDPCSIDNTQFGCPGYVDPCLGPTPPDTCPVAPATVAPPPTLLIPLIPFLRKRRRRRRYASAPHGTRKLPDA